MRYRRRRHQYTPKQESTRKELHKAEMWLNVVATGIADQLKREHYCQDGMRSVINCVNTQLEEALADLEKATKKHDEAFARTRRFTIRPKRKQKKHTIIARKGRPRP